MPPRVGRHEFVHADHFFANGGTEAYVVRVAAETVGDVLEPAAALVPPERNGGVYLLDGVDLFNLLCVPGETRAATVAKLQAYAQERRAFCILDAPRGALAAGPDAALLGPAAKNSALYHPWVKAADPLQENHIRDFPPCGFVAGVYARTDATAGVWKSPAGSEARLVGASGVERVLTDGESDALGARGVDCIRSIPSQAAVVWGSRTLGGADPEWKYVPVRRLALFIEESVLRGTGWVVFEPNDERLWARIRLSVGAFMHALFRQGAFQGASPRDAFFVKCDSETTTRSDRDVVSILVGFAPPKPAEFVVARIQRAVG